MYVIIYLRKEDNILFHDALNTLLNLRLYGVNHMVDNESNAATSCATLSD